MTTLFLALAARPAEAACGPEGCLPPAPEPEAPARNVGPVPPIDRDRPAEVAVATFALG